MAVGLNRRERKKMHSKQAIIDAALKLFREKGYQETAVADIMSGADLGIGTFYNYFHAKEDILKYLLGRMITEINRFSEELREQDRPAAAVLTEMALFAARLLDQNRFVLPLFLSARPSGGGITHSAEGRTLKSIFGVIIESGQRSGEFRRDIPAAIITEMFHSVFQAASFSSLEISFIENIQYKLQLILAGMVVASRPKNERLDLKK